jgi:hypothetical protein
MNIFTKYFHATTDKTEWPVLATAISSGLQEVKRSWFRECAVAMDLGLMSDKSAKARVVNTELGGAGALAITAYQICCVKALSSHNRYVPKSLLEEFLDLLCSRVSGAEGKELSKYIRRYDEVSDDQSTQRFRFGLDIARYVINEEPSMIISLHAASLAQKLFVQTSMVVAKTFGDTAAIHKMSREVKLINKPVVL